MTTNVIVLSKAGKLIFSRYGSGEDLIAMCGIVQALLATASQVAQDGSGGGIKFISCKNLNIAFLSIGYITLLAVESTERGQQSTEPFLTLLLEHVYSQIVFLLTDQMQQIFQRSPSFDMRTLLGATERVMEGLLLNSAALFAGGVQILPLEPSLRVDVSDLLFSSTRNIPDTLFSMLVVSGKLVTMLQLPRREYQIHTMDLQLILNFVKHQPGLLETESWIPICLPRFESSTFVYAYINRIESSTDLTLVCIGVQHSTAQFELYRSASAVIKSSMGIKLESPRQQAAAALSSLSSMAYMTTSLAIPHLCPLVEALRCSNLQQNLIREYYQIASTFHFLFRLDIVDPQKKGPSGNVVQFFQLPFQYPFAESNYQQYVWIMYQKLALRLRNGSAQAERSFFEMDRIEEIIQEQRRGGNKHFETENATVGSSECTLKQSYAAHELFEKRPLVNGISYIIKGSEMFIAINGKDCSLYAVLSSTISVTVGASICARLIGKLLADRNILFLESIRTWP